MNNLYDDEEFADEPAEKASAVVEYDAQIYDWSVVFYKSPVSHGSDVCIRGKAICDKKKLFYNGEVITTSKVVSWDLEKMIVKTQNSVYQLVGAGRNTPIEEDKNPWGKFTSSGLGRSVLGSGLGAGADWASSTKTVIMDDPYPYLGDLSYDAHEARKEKERKMAKHKEELEEAKKRRAWYSNWYDGKPFTKPKKGA